MRSFKDSAGRDWLVVVNYSTRGRVMALAQLDLFDLKVFEQIGINPALLIDVLYGVCQEQVEKIPLTKEQFCNALTGDAIELAADALLHEIIDFFPSSRRNVLNKLLATAQQVQGKAMELIDAKLSSGDLIKQLEASLNLPSGSVPESAAFTPAPSHSASSP